VEQVRGKGTSACPQQKRCLSQTVRGIPHASVISDSPGKKISFNSTELGMLKTSSAENTSKRIKTTTHKQTENICKSYI
jgi:hypothetical protein